jgi:site-specific DNA recombinase
VERHGLSRHNQTVRPLRQHADLMEPSRSVVVTDQVKHNAQPCRKLAVQRGSGEASGHGQRFEPGWDVLNRVCVHSAAAALVASVERCQQFDDLAATHLPDHQPVGPHPQRLAHQVTHGHLSGSFDVRRPGLERDDVRMGRPFLYTLQVRVENRKIAAIYARISDDKTGERLGVMRQIDDCEQLAASLGFEATEHFIDNDISAFSGKRRPEYERLLDDIKCGRVDTVITWHNDRLHRSPLELEHYIEISEKHGVVTHTVRAGYFDLSTPVGRMTARQLGTIARYESEHRSERIRRKTLQKAEAGEYHGGAVRPFGFESDGVTHRESEAQTIKQITTDVLAGRSLRSIIRDLNSRGIKSVRGTEWSYTTLRGLLLRPRNAGLRQHRGQVIGDAVWDPIVPREDFQRLERLLRDPSRKTTRNNTHRHLLSGIATCGVCGKGVKSGATKTRAGETRRVYRCCVVRNMAQLDQHIEHCLRVVLANQPWEIPTGLGEANVDIRTQLAQLDSKMQEAALAFASNAITMRQLSTINTELGTERHELEGQLVETTSADYDYFVGLPNGLDIDEIPLEEKRIIVRSLFSVHLLPVGKGWKKQPYSIEDGVKIEFLGDFVTTGEVDLERRLWGARLNPSQVRTLRRAIQGFPEWEIARA